MQHSDSAVDPNIIGGSVGGCLAFIVGVAVAVFVVRYLYFETPCSEYTCIIMSSLKKKH